MLCFRVKPSQGVVGLSAWRQVMAVLPVYSADLYPAGMDFAQALQLADLSGFPAVDYQALI
jgi:hypothetical protein